MLRKKRYLQLNLEPALKGLARKSRSGQPLSSVERHLLANAPGLKNNIFAPSLAATILHFFGHLVPPVLVVTLFVSAALFGIERITIDKSRVAQIREEQEVQRAVQMAEKGLALDREFSFYNSTVRQAQLQEGDLYKESIVSFIDGIITTYQPKMADSRRIAREIVETSQRENIDPFFVAAIIAAESSFRPHAKSPVGALGLMQLLPSTAKEVSRKRNKGNSPQLTHPKTNIELGIDYIRTLEKQFGGNRHQALAAYNWGPANVKKVNRGLSSIPGSVEGYSRKILEKTFRWQRRFKNESLATSQAEATLREEGLALSSAANG